ncbi:MAG TPA: class I SAM-dependent methyltransferase [Chloroflexota bacterium]|jgi:SAM-dependent methyltransferase|nr:class I SAM-dependent methyltransferase [Chloroflexota bacterium]
MAKTSSTGCQTLAAAARLTGRAAAAGKLCRVQRNGVAQDGALVRAEQPWGDEQLAGLYDAFSFDGDLSLYLELAAAQGQRVLEVACGSGRVLVPLVQSGFGVVGVDISPHMLAIARAKLQDLPAAMQERAELVKGDMRTFDLPRREFDLAVVAVKSFAYLTERSDQVATLVNIARHLRDGGVLAIDFMHPRLDWLGAANGTMKDDLLQTVRERGFTLSRVESVVSTDLARQVRVIRSIYERIDTHGAVLEKRFVEWPYRWTHRFEAEHLLERAGFEIDGLYGGYEREPFTSGSATMLFVARKTQPVR